MKFLTRTLVKEPAQQYYYYYYLTAAMKFLSRTLVMMMLVVVPPELTTAATESSNVTTYGIDVSFPIHGRVSDNYLHLDHNVDRANHPPRPARYEGMPLQILGNRQATYLQHLDSCRSAYAPSTNSFSCDEYEYDRMLMNRRQPQSMVNLTKTGFQKIRAPPNLKDLIDDFWQKNKDKGTREAWQPGNSYVNHWSSPTTLISVDDMGLRGSGAKLKEHIWAAASATMEEWTNQELQPCSLYGIRVYKEGAIMLPHVDRLPLVVSAVISVAQDVDEPWPTEIYDHDGNAHNVTLEPGDMLLFESHSAIHGHPFPLKGRYVALIFIHFEPTGHTFEKNESGYYYLRHEDEHSKTASKKKSLKDINKEYHENSIAGIGGQSSSMTGSLPPYIKREGPEESHWRQQHPHGWEPPETILPPEAHIAAKKGQLAELERELKERKTEVLTERDEHGWQILHQGVAGGHEEVVELLVSSGAEINSRTHGGYGETPLRIAEKRLGLKSPIVKYLKGLGALSIGPEL